MTLRPAASHAFTGGQMMSATVADLRPGIHPTTSPLEAAFNEGRLLFMRGGERPPQPPDDMQCTPEAVFGRRWDQMLFREIYSINAYKTLGA